MSEEIHNSGEYRHYGMPWHDPFSGPTCLCDGVIHANRCGTTISLMKGIEKNPSIKETYRAKEIERRNRINSLSRLEVYESDAPSSASYVSPSGASQVGIKEIDVFFHVIYNSEVHPEDNLSNEILQSQIDVLNADFRKQNLDVPPRWANRAADTQISFTWDTQNINRVDNTGVVEWPPDDSMKFTDQGGSDAVSSEDYLNIWVCYVGEGVLGYATFPGTVPPEQDGVVISSVTLPGGEAPYDMGRTATHEVGHYLNLFHTWGDGDCTVDDGVSDTPESSGPSAGCDLSRDSCPKSANKDMVENYMDYSDDACMGLFTYGQRRRMIDCLLEDRPNIWSTTVVSIFSGCESGVFSGVSGACSGMVSGLASGISGASGISHISGQWFQSPSAPSMIETWMASDIPEAPGSWRVVGDSTTWNVARANWSNSLPAAPDPLDPVAALDQFNINSAASASRCTHTLGYSLKKEYFGETTAWRNVETFTREYLLNEALPFTNVNFNTIKAAIVNEITSEVTAAKRSINIISVDVPTSADYTEGMVTFQKMVTVYEVRSLVLNNTDLNDSDTYGTLHSNYLSPYVSDIEQFNESFNLEKGDSGEYTYSHEISFTARDGVRLSAAKIATAIGEGLLSSAEENSLNFLLYSSKYDTDIEVQNAHSAARKTFSETYDTLKNSYSFSFSLKFKVGTDNVSDCSFVEKYSLDMGNDGIIKVSQNLSILGRYNFNDALNGLTQAKLNSFNNCNALYNNFKNHDGTKTTNALSLNSEVLDESYSYLQPNLSIEYSCSFSNDPSSSTINGSRYTKQESINWSMEENGISTIEVDVTLISHGEKPNENSMARQLTDLISVGMVSLCEVNHSETSVSALFNGRYPTLVNQVSSKISARELNGFYLNTFSKTSRSIATELSRRDSNSIGGRNISYKSSYSNDPTLNRKMSSRLFSLGQGIIKKAETKISTDMPSDVVREFNIIGNRTILNYPFKMTEGSVSVSLDLVLKRPASSRLGSVQNAQYVALTNPSNYRDLIRNLITQVIIPEAKDVLFVEPRLAGAAEVSLIFNKISFNYTSTGEVSISCEAQIRCKKSANYVRNVRIGNIIR